MTPTTIVIAGSCGTSISLTSDGTIGKEGYCVQKPVPAGYEVTYTFNSPDREEFYKELLVWANAGNVYNDGELRFFDLTVNYLDGTGSPATLSATGISIGDTTGVNDMKTVTFASLGWPTAISGISTIILSNLDGPGTIEIPWREVQLGDADPDISVVKSASTNDGGDGILHAGDTVDYTYVVTNTGIPTLFNVNVTENSGTFTGTGTLPSPAYSSGGDDYDSGAGTATDLRQGETVTFTASYTLTSSDISSGNLTNQANTNGVDFHTATASDLSGTANNNDDTTSVNIPQISELGVTKTADNDTNRALNDNVEYTYVVTNTGNTTISNISLLDTHNGSGPAPTPGDENLANDLAPTGDTTDTGADGIWDALGPGDSVTFKGYYAITQADIDNLQ